MRVKTRKPGIRRERTRNGDLQVLEGDWNAIVIGAGSSGCVLASRLVRNGATVLLLDAGPTPERFFYRNNLLSRLANWPTVTSKGSSCWPGRITAKQQGLGGRRLPAWGGRGGGGGSAVNAGIYQRGRQEDYENWPWSSEEILSSFQSIEAELALEWVDGGPIAQEFLDAVVQNGGIEIPKITKSNDGGGKLPQEPSFTTTDNGICSGIWFTTAGGRRRTSWDTFIAPLLDMPNLTVLHDFFARRILWEKSEKGGGQLRASGVEGALNGSPLKILFSSSSSSGDSYSKDKPHEILLCCGAVGSPVLLMHSGVGPRRSLQQAGISVSCDAPKVGVGLQDHIVLPIVWYLPGGSNTSLSTTTTYSNGVRAAIEAKASNGSALQLLLHDFTNSLEIIGSCSRYLFVSTLIRWIIFVTLWILFNFPFSRMILKLLLKRSFFVTSICLTGVTSSGNIALTSSDPYEMPIIDPCYLSEESEWAAFEEGLKLARLSASCILKEERGLDNLLRTWHSRISTTLPPAACHVVCHTEGVVVVRLNGRKELRVRGVNGVRVVDCSIACHIPSGPTNAMAMMIGDCAARVIIDQWADSKRDGMLSSTGFSDLVNQVAKGQLAPESL